MARIVGKAFGAAPVFAPREGTLVRAPLGAGPGWWAGAPCATFDAATNTFYLVYRLRQPRELGRGVECRIAASDNGIAFTDIWALPKTSLSALSIERTCLTRGLDGRWRLYVSHVDPGDHRWRISMLEGDEPDRLDVGSASTLLTADDVGGEGVKDPNVFLFGQAYYMLASYATKEPAPSPDAEARKHASGDIYNTGLTLSRTGAAISGDGRSFQWIGDVSPICHGDGGAGAAPRWDDYCRRIGALAPMDTGGYLAFYDGSASVEENYEEKTGLAVTFDLRTYYSLSSGAPTLVSPDGSGSLRYVDVLTVGHELFYYYEIARPDGSHDLRVSVVERD
ncbi:MAG TPA: hypothetical protein VKT77_15275 [Chthonomonadaceae bacterium]|nr:hypothetical protein [Chthonomonadaceae bacterium]